jgi:2-isopropylmalate synthase
MRHERNRPAFVPFCATLPGPGPLPPASTSVRYVRIFDSTLRDGVDGLGVAIAPARRARLARLIGALLPDVVEAGYTRALGGLAAIEAAAQALRDAADPPIVAALAPLDLASVVRAANAGARLVNIYAPAATCSLDAVAEVVEAARLVPGVVEVQFSLQAVTSAGVPAERLRAVVTSASLAGADVVSLADSAGEASPAQIHNITALAGESISAGGRVSIHAHNDLGLALANTIAAVEAGASQAEVTLAGIGTRAGNCAAEELAAALPVCVPGAATGYLTGDLDVLLEAAVELQDATGFALGGSKPILGSGALRRGFRQLDT